MASLKAFRDAFKAALAADSELATWSTTWFAASITIFADPQAAPVNDDEKPAIVIGRARAASPDEPQVGNTRADKTIDLPFDVLWSETNPTRANDEHCELHDILSKIILRNRMLGGAEAIGLVVGEAGETQQPLQAFSAAVRAEYGITA